MSNEIALSMLNNLGNRTSLKAGTDEDVMIPDSGTPDNNTPDSHTSVTPEIIRQYAVQIHGIAEDYILRYNLPSEEQLGLAQMICVDALDVRRELEQELGTDRDLMELALLTVEDSLFDNFQTALPNIQAYLNAYVGQSYQEVSPARNPHILSYQEYKQCIEKKKITASVRDDIDDKCPICLDGFKLGRTVHKTVCGHHFHPRCLQYFVCKVGPNACPVCRTPVQPLQPV